MAKLKVNVDEKWPIFSVEEADKDGPFVIELDDELYKQYLQIDYLYYSFQTRLQVLYESEQRKLSERCPYSFPKGSDIGEHLLNKIRTETSE